MADDRKYYYLKLKDNFFDSDSMVLLEGMDDGYLYSNILLKLYLKSLKDNGRLILNGRIPYSTKMIASVTRHQVETVEKALDIFEELGLVEVLDSGVIYMLDIQNFIGESSTEADRKRAYRAKIEAEKTGGHLSGQMSGQNSPEIEKEIEIKKEDICSEPKVSEPDPSGILLTLNDKTVYDVPLSKIEKWKIAYPAVDVEQELRKMGAWLDANPTKRKTKRGIDRFINTWLAKEQDRGGIYRGNQRQQSNGLKEEYQSDKKLWIRIPCESGRDEAEYFISKLTEDESFADVPVVLYAGDTQKNIRLSCAYNVSEKALIPLCEKYGEENVKLCGCEGKA